VDQGNLITKAHDESPYLTFPPQNSQFGPCHPSRHKQVPLTHTPFPLHVTSLQSLWQTTDTAYIHMITNRHTHTTHLSLFLLYFDLKRNKNISAILKCRSHPCDVTVGNFSPTFIIWSRLILRKRYFGVKHCYFRKHCVKI